MGWSIKRSSGTAGNGPPKQVKIEAPWQPLRDLEQRREALGKVNLEVTTFQSRKNFMGSLVGLHQGGHEMVCMRSHVRGHKTRADTRDADAVRTEFEVQTLAQVIESGFAGCVGQGPGQAIVARHTADEGKVTVPLAA